MEEEAPPRRSVAELAGRFKGSAAAHDAAGTEAQKPVRRRPPRSLQLPMTHDQQPPGVTSPLPAKAKRNSALIEKLQANLALSPSASSPKSPGVRLLSPAFPPPHPSSAQVTTATPTSPDATSPAEEGRPASFEAPPTVVEGSILLNINKGRARHSVRRRPPSRQHRKSSSGDEVTVASEGGRTSPNLPREAEDTTPGGGGGGEGGEGGEGEEGGEGGGGRGGEGEEGGGGGGGGGGGEGEEGGEVFKQEVKDNETAASAHPKKQKSHEEDPVEPKGDDEKEEEEDASAGGEEGDRPSSGGKEEEEEETSAEQQEEDLTDSKEEVKMEETTSAR